MSRLTVLLGVLVMSVALLAGMWPIVEPQAKTLLDQALLPYRIAQLVAEPADETLLMPVEGVRVRDVADTWGDPRGTDRGHEGQDIFADRGTIVRPVAEGYVMRVGHNRLGGSVLFILGAGGRGYYYAHLDGFGPDAVMGKRVTEESIVGYVGTSGNASGTPPHLHLGIYSRAGTIDPLPLLVDRP